MTLVQVATMVPSPWEHSAWGPWSGKNLLLLLFVSRRLWERLRCAREGAQGSPLPCTALSSSPPLLQCLGWKLSRAKCGLLVPYLEFCLNWWQFGPCQDDEQSGSRQGTAVWIS